MESLEKGGIDKPKFNLGVVGLFELLERLIGTVLIDSQSIIALA